MRQKHRTAKQDGIIIPPNIKFNIMRTQNAAFCKKTAFFILGNYFIISRRL